MYDGIVQELIDEFGWFFGIGLKFVQWIVFYILQMLMFDVVCFVELFSEICMCVWFCEICGNVVEQEWCVIC